MARRLLFLRHGGQPSRNRPASQSWEQRSDPLRERRRTDLRTQNRHHPLLHESIRRDLPSRLVPSAQRGTNVPDGSGVGRTRVTPTGHSAVAPTTGRACHAGSVGAGCSKSPLAADAEVTACHDAKITPACVRQARGRRRRPARWRLVVESGRKLRGAIHPSTGASSGGHCPSGARTRGCSVPATG